MTAPILGSDIRPDGRTVVTYGRRDFSQGQLVITSALRGDPNLQAVVDSLFEHKEFTAQMVSRKQERARTTP